MQEWILCSKGNSNPPVRRAAVFRVLDTGYASVQVCGYHNTKGINAFSRLQLCGVVTKRHFTFGKRFAGSTALVYVPTDFDTKEKALSGANAAEKGLK